MGGYVYYSLRPDGLLVLDPKLNGGKRQQSDAIVERVAARFLMLDLADAAAPVSKSRSQKKKAQKARKKVKEPRMQSKKPDEECQVGPRKGVVEFQWPQGCCSGCRAHDGHGRPGQESLKPNKSPCSCAASSAQNIKVTITIE